MSDGNAAAWAHVVLQAIEVVGSIGGVIGGMAVLLARRTFATRVYVEALVTGHSQEHRALEKRLSEGDNRMTALTGAIRSVELSAGQAKDAADEARDAADRIGDVNTNLAGLRGDLKALEATMRPIERLTMDMVEGHMAVGLKGNSK